MNGQSTSMQLRDFVRIRGLRDGVSIREAVMDSTRHFRETRSLTVLGLLIAVQIALGLVATISIGQFVRISFGFIALASVGMLFGPVPAMACGAISDVFLHMIRPLGPYFPGFTITAMLAGFLYGLVFYKRRIALFNIVIAKLTVNLFVNLVINSVNLWILYGALAGGELITRAIKNGVTLPIEVALLSAVLPIVYTAYKRVFKP